MKRTGPPAVCDVGVVSKLLPTIYYYFANLNPFVDTVFGIMLFCTTKGMPFLSLLLGTLSKTFLECTMSVMTTLC